ENARTQGDFLKQGLSRLVEKFPQVFKSVRGLGLMVGLELAPGIRAFAGSDKPPAIQFVQRLHEAGLLAVPAGMQVLRLLPPLNLRRSEAEEGVAIIGSVG